MADNLDLLKMQLEKCDEFAARFEAELEDYGLVCQDFIKQKRRMAECQEALQATLAGWDKYRRELQQLVRNLGERPPHDPGDWWKRGDQPPGFGE